MAFVALIGLYFVPLLCLMGAAWSYAAVAVVVFLALKFAFPVT